MGLIRVAAVAPLQVLNSHLRVIAVTMLQYQQQRVEEAPLAISAR